MNLNLRMVVHLLGWVLCIESLFLCFPILAGLFFWESVIWIYIGVALGCLAVGFALTRCKPKRNDFYAPEGFVTVALSWVLLGMTGAIPFVLTGEIPFYIDALFETVSGFTTTGATILTDVESLSKASLLWRSTTHWVGGMGVLVFVLAIIPLVGGHSIYLLRAESPGPSVNKFGPHMKDTAITLYKIYIAMTLLQIVLLLVGRVPFFDALNIAMSTAGTGGFGLYNNSIAGYSVYVQVVVAIFMLLFGVNFNLYYALLYRRAKDVFKSEELRVYLGLAAFATITIAVNIMRQAGSVGEALNLAFFQVTSIMSTTGFSTTDFNLWPDYSRTLLVLLTIIGACAGSTAGGIKISRLILLFKNARRELRFMNHPRSVEVIHFEGKRVQHEVSRSVNAFLIVYLMIFAFSMLLLSADHFDFVTNFTATATTLGNVGPGLNVVGPLGNFSGFQPISKLMLIFDMLAGRLELFPMLLLFAPSTWRNR